MRVLIVGGGIAGMSCSIALKGIGAEVDLVDIDPQWRVYGAGITITRPTWRAFARIGILDELMQTGFGGDGIKICATDGTVLNHVADPALDDQTIPGSGGIMRPDLHRILSGRVRGIGIEPRLGITIDALDQQGEAAVARFSDGSSGTYDLVIGADGLFSRVRRMIMPDAPVPEYTGQMIWRLFAPRPAGIHGRHYFLGGRYKVGLSPVSETHIYLFLLETVQKREIIPDPELHKYLHAMLEGYGGPLAELRDGLDETSPIVVRPLEAFLLPPPWHVGRTLLVGDAAHPTTPHLASGAGMAVEDAVVLAEELGKRQDDIDSAFRSYTERRWSRCRAVVENSLEIGRREQAGRPPEEQTALIGKTLDLLAQPL